MPRIKDGDIVIEELGMSDEEIKMLPAGDKLFGLLKKIKILKKN